MSRTIVTPTDATSIEELMARARVDFAEQRYEAAASGFDRVTQLDPTGPLAPEAWMQSAAARDQLGDLEGAAARYEEVARRHPTERVARDALVRAVRLLSHLEQWERTGRAADALVARAGELPPIERIVAYGGKALALVFSDDPDAAAYFIEKGRGIVDEQRLDAAGAIPRDLAQLYFALGELRRIRGERIRFEPVPADFGAALEQRCQLLLDAQSAYSDAMRAYDAHWSAMAGYRVGELYQRLHEEVMRVRPPASADSTAKAELFAAAMRLRYSVLLRKGLAMMEHTRALAERTGERSSWVLRAEESRKQLERSLKEEAAALDRLPYARADLERALSTLARKRK